MTKLDRIAEIMAAARNAIDDFEVKCLKGEATIIDKAMTAGRVAAMVAEARMVAARVDRKDAE